MQKKPVTEKRRLQLLASSRKWNAKNRPPKFRRINHAGAPISKEMILSCIKVSPLNQCWEWQRAKKPFGYGMMWSNGRGVIIHRKAYELWVGPIPEGLCVLHRCDNPPCCNPEHLFLGTYKDNNVDCVNKKRHWSIKNPHLVPHGELATNAKLSKKTVLDVRALFNSGMLSQRNIAKMTGVNYKTVNDIVLGKSWCRTC